MYKQNKRKPNAKLLLAIWALKKLGFTNYAIANLGKQLPVSHHTVSDYYKIACKKVSRGELPIFPYKWIGKSKREVYVGSSADLEQLYTREYQRPTDE